MKKMLFAAAVAFLVLTGSLSAQKQLYFGLGGTGLSSVIINQNYYGYTDLDFKFTMGMAGAVNVGFDFNKHLGLKLELGMAKLGQNYSDVLPGDSTLTRIVRLNYFQIPLLFKYRTGGEVARFYVAVGPQFNFLMSAKEEYLINDGTLTDSIPGNLTKPTLISESTITDRYNSIDILGRLDLGVDITITKNLFCYVGMTMAYGFTDINATAWQIKDSDGNYNPSHNAYGGINFGINYTLPLGKD